MRVNRKKWSGRKDLNLRPLGPELSVRNTHVIDSVSLRDHTLLFTCEFCTQSCTQRGSYLRSGELSAIAHVPSKWKQIRSKSWTSVAFAMALMRSAPVRVPMSLLSSLCNLQTSENGYVTGVPLPQYCSVKICRGAMTLCLISAHRGCSSAPN
jgi:hypothetical protein